MGFKKYLDEVWVEKERNMRTLKDEISEYRKLLGKAKEIKFYQNDKFFILEKDSKIIYYMKYKTINDNIHISSRENFSNLKNLTITVIAFITSKFDTKIYDDIVFNEPGFKTLKKCIKSDLFDSYISNRYGIEKIDYNDFEKIIKNNTSEVFHIKKNSKIDIFEHAFEMFDYEDKLEPYVSLIKDMELE